MSSELTIIGRAERADLPDLHAEGVPVKIDTGADASSIWAHVVETRGDRLHVIFFDKASDFYTSEEHVFEPDEYTITRVANSFGHRELRYKVKLRIRIKKRLINGTFTLSDRSKKLYPILIGRSLLKNKFLVDVSKGNPLRAAENERAERLKNEIEIIQGKAEL
ncbi:ATP-dependent zinc protease [Candidatus Saccharibacteria bacterium]|nr:ATP-dependent zinc protease [Candidatus Saccharibacteria bacterium]